MSDMKDCFLKFSLMNNEGYLGSLSFLLLYGYVDLLTLDPKYFCSMHLSIEHSIVPNMPNKSNILG